MVFPPEWEIIYKLELVDYKHIQADKPWYGFYPVRTNKKISVLRVTGLKILGRVGTHFFDNFFIL